MSKYAGPHRQLRTRLARAVEAGQATCWRCGLPIAPGTAWHLGHDDRGERWIGPEHAACNLRAAARATNAKRSGTPTARWSRHWYGEGFDCRCPDCRRRGAACDAATGHHSR